MPPIKKINSKTPKEPKLKNVLTVANIQNQTVTRIDLINEWLAAFGKPQDRGVWFVWGGSGSGKSTFIMMLAKQLSKTYKTLYNLLEEETDDTDYIDRIVSCNMNEVEDNFNTSSFNYKELIQYINKRNSAKVIIVDSITYLTKDWDAYQQLKALINKKEKILILVGHAEGKNPRSEFEKSIRFDAKMKIYIAGFLAQCQGRTIGENGGRFVIWKQGYEKINGVST